MLTFELWIKTQIKYDGNIKCIVYGCNKPGLYEGGDSRCYCPMCAEHADMAGRYLYYLNKNIKIPMNKKLNVKDAYLLAKRKEDKLLKRIEEALNGTN